MDVLQAVLNVQPDTWVKKSADSYGSSYLLFDVEKFSVEWYRIWMDLGIYRSNVNCIRRVQNPFQFGLFKIQLEKRRNEGCATQQEFGYHLIHPNDLDSALKYPLDYRRYSNRDTSVQSEEKQPKFYSSFEDAFDMGQQCPHLALNDELCIIKVDHFSTVKNQGDYYPLYVITAQL